MRAKRLLRPVLVKGWSLLWFRTEMMFIPTEKPGWTLRFADGMDAARPVTAFNLRKGLSRHLDIAEQDWPYKSEKLKVVEHLWAARLGLGLYDGVIVTVPTHGIPYCGHSGIFNAALTPALGIAARPRRFTVRRKITVPGRRDKSFASFEPSGEDLVVHTEVDYGGTAKDSYTWRSSVNTFDEIAESMGELKPHLRHLVYVAGSLGWPHRHTYADRSCMPEKKWVGNLLRHRAVDAIGALGLATPCGMLCGIYRNKCAGHPEDATLVHEVARELVEI